MNITLNTRWSASVPTVSGAYKPVSGRGDNKPSRAKHLLVLQDRKVAPQTFEDAWEGQRQLCLELVNRKPDLVMDEGGHVSASSWWKSPNAIDEGVKPKWLADVSMFGMLHSGTQVKRQRTTVPPYSVSGTAAIKQEVLCTCITAQMERWKGLPHPPKREVMNPRDLASFLRRGQG